MPNTSHNMHLSVPIIGVDTGLTWEQSVVADLNIIDMHDHSQGNGVQIQPSGIRITSDLAFNSENATLLRTTRYTPQTTAIPANEPDLGCVYVAGTDLYYNDLDGNQVQLTSGGSVNATSSGISDGTATASFVSSVLVVNSDTDTPANIQAGSILIGNNVAASHFVTLSPPTALAADYTLILPALPGSTSFVTLDSSGNFGATIPTASGIVNSNIAAGTITSSRIAAATIQDSNLAILKPSGVTFSTFSTTSLTPVVVTGSTVGITTAGGSVIGIFNVTLTQSHNGATFTLNQDSTYQVFRDATLILSNKYSTVVNNGTQNTPGGGLNFLDAAPAGFHQYSLVVFSNNVQTVTSVSAGNINVIEI